MPRGVRKSIRTPRQSSECRHSLIPNRLPGLRLAGKSSLLLKRGRQQGEHKQHLHILNSILAPPGLFLSRQEHNRSARPGKGQGTTRNVGQRARKNKSRAREWLRPLPLVTASGSLLGWAGQRDTKATREPCRSVGVTTGQSPHPGKDPGSAGTFPEPRGQAGAGSSASSPVARTTGCDGATAARAGSGVLGCAGRTGGRFGVLGEPPQVSGPYQKPPEVSPAPHGQGRGRGQVGQWENRDGAQWDKLRSRWIRQGTAAGSRCHIPMSLPLQRHWAGSRGWQGVPCAPRPPSAPGRGAGNARRLRSSHKGAASFLCCWCHGNLSHLA